MHTKPFNQITKKDVDIAGGKGASLGEMTQANIPVPEGYVILSQSFDKFLEQTDLNVEIDTIISKVNHNDINSVNVASETITDLIRDKEIPKDTSKEILSEFKKLKTKYVAVRSSATAEDSSIASWAGELETYLNTTEKELLANVKKCWASLFTPRAIFYRFEKKLNKQKVSVAVVVQKMIQSEISGITFTVHPVTEDRNQMVVEAGYGLGEAIVGGKITPDTYIIDKENFTIQDKNISQQEMKMIKTKDKGIEEVSVSQKDQEKQKLEDKNILELARLCHNIEKHYNFPQDIEWAFENNKLYITQSRPITTLGLDFKEKDSTRKSFKAMLEAKNIVRIEGDFVPFLMMIDWLNFYDKKGSLKNIYPVLAYYLDNRIVAYVDGDKYMGCSREIFSDLVNGDQDIKKIEEKYNNSKIKIKEVYDKFFSKEGFDKSENNLLSIYKNIYEELQELVAHTLFIEQLDEKIISEIVARKQLDFDRIWKLVNYQTFLSFESRNNSLILDYLRGGRSIKYLTYIFLNYTIVPNVDYLKKELKKYEIEELEKEIKETNLLINKESSIFEKEIKSLSEEEKEAVEIIKWAMLVRDDRKNYINMAEAILYYIAEELFDVWRLDKKLLRNVGMLEIPLGVDYLKDNLSYIENRSKGFSLDINPNHSYEFNYKNVESEIKQLDQAILDKSNSKNKNEIRGSIGNSGVTRGNARIILKLEEFDKFQEGEILVTGMTRPEFVPLMKKSKAIITDEGGITSHAAIVSRELKKPCIIGTKFATQILKDGDLVEVDANEGIVRILKKGR